MLQKGDFLMREFFSLDGPFTKYGTLVADTLILSFMWILFSIPIITIGAATSAMFYVSTRRIADREGYITSDFWSAFKANFKRATLLWLLVLFVSIILFINVFLMMFGEAEGEGFFGGMLTVALPAQFIFIIQMTFLCTYMFPMTARFEMGFLQTIKNSFIMANKHFLTSISCLVLLVALIIFGLMTQVLMIMVPGTYAMLSSYLIMRVFKKYRPEIDKDPRLEIAEIEAQKAEERRRRDFSDSDE